MSRWKTGEAEIERFLQNGELQQLVGEAANGKPMLAKAAQKLVTARTALDSGDFDSALTLAYDASRIATSGLLMQQGLRPTTDGGQVVVVQAMRAQFGNGFRQLDPMRRRRHELEYFKRAGDSATEVEATDAVLAADSIIEAAEKLIDSLGLFG